MTKRTRRKSSGAFKAKVAIAALKGDRTLSELAKASDGHPDKITHSRDDPLAGAASLFERGHEGSREAAVDVKALHAKIGELTPENFFEGLAQCKAGMLSARR